MSCRFPSGARERFVQRRCCSAQRNRLIPGGSFLAICQPRITSFWSTLRPSGQSTCPNSPLHGFAPLGRGRTGGVATAQSLPCVSVLCFAADNTRTRRDLMTTCVKTHLHFANGSIMVV